MPSALLTIDGDKFEMGLSSFSFSFSQNIGITGTAISDVTGGEIQFEGFSTASTSEAFLMSWMVDPGKRFSGRITVDDNEGQLISKLEFNFAACIGYTQTGSSTDQGLIITEKVTIFAQEIIMADATFPQ